VQEVLENLQKGWGRVKNPSEILGVLQTLKAVGK